MSNGGPRIAIAINPDMRMLRFAAVVSVAACLLQPRQVIALVLRETAMPVALGLVFGVAAAIPTTRLAEAMLFGVRPEDPATFIAACTALTMLALAAAWVPGRRAARLNPVSTLRSE